MSSPITSLTKHSKEKKKKRKSPGDGRSFHPNSGSFDAEEAGVASRGIIIVDTSEDASRNFSDLKFRAGESTSLIQVQNFDVKPVVLS